MPQGKGTYGKQVGRPPEYKDGGNVDPFSLKNPEGVPAKEAEKLFKDIPVSNAMERSQVSPDTEKYNNGGKLPDKRTTGTEGMDFDSLGEKEEHLDWWLNTVTKPLTFTERGDPSYPGGSNILDIVANRAEAKEAREGAETQRRIEVEKELIREGLLEKKKGKKK